jgi:ubiquinone/menaquinone biosynthesis C-methylase UbiE
MTDDHDHPPIDMSKFYVLPSQEITLPEIDNRDGLILDVGGGGEGIIGLLKGSDVVAIDKRKGELTETNNDALKVVMDATDLQFVDESFTVATAYFTFMYIPTPDIETVLQEVWRVLKPGGEFFIWDAVVHAPPEEREKKSFVIFLKTNLPNGQENQTGYGGSLRELDIDTVLKPAQNVGFSVIQKKRNEYTYFLKLQKP